jgi:hypothetical protein
MFAWLYDKKQDSDKIPILTKPNKPTEICEACFYCQGLETLKCHRYPPIPCGDKFDFPLVEPFDWCGEFYNEGAL